MNNLKLKLLEMKMQIQGYYMEALETQNFHRANFLRGKLALIEQILKETWEE